jgi:hypothetical protein
LKEVQWQRFWWRLATERRRPAAFGKLLTSLVDEMENESSLSDSLGESFGFFYKKCVDLMNN